MLHSVQSQIGLKLGALDGEIGTIRDYYFDDRSWKIRYVVADTGGWLFGRTVLLPPRAFGEPDWERNVLPVNLTKEQIKNSPEMFTDQPVSIQQEIELHRHYGWTDYAGTQGMGFVPIPMVDRALEAQETDNDLNTPTETEVEGGDPHLRSCKNITRYTVHGGDGELGEVTDYLIHVKGWHVPFLVVTTRSWYGGKVILITTSDVKYIEWESSGMYIIYTRETCLQAPNFDYQLPLSRDLEPQLRDTYGYRG